MTASEFLQTWGALVANGCFLVVGAGVWVKLGTLQAEVRNFADRAKQRSDKVATHTALLMRLEFRLQKLEEAIKGEGNGGVRKDPGKD